MIKLALGLGASAALGLVLTGTQATSGSKTTADGIYSADQAKRGAELYASTCSFCHGAQMEGRAPMPPLSGDAFTAKWSNQHLDALFEKIQTTMPATKPGSLTRAQNADITAFILSTNGYKAGTTDLPSDKDALDQIQFVAPPAK
jgi:S-disulfanyl-L-cysteine oxidoreductase SoxD